ncbi:MAG: arylsulfatase [Marinifilaceae bacterium]|nr:arylsulfatase [Marinifilaceae bacterium]
MNMNQTLLLAGTSLLFGTSCANLSKSKSESSKPNIIYILADDMGYGDLGCYGQRIFETPNLDLMASQGIRFINHYTGSTVCAPSRCALLTGKHTGHSVVRGNKEIQPEGQMAMPAGTRTAAHFLQKAGYSTGCVGKWGLGYPGSESDPLNMGFDYFFGYNCQMKAHHYFPEYLWENDQKIFYPENSNGQQKMYSHDETTRKAFSFIKENKEKPFFLYLAYAIPHAELVIPEEYLAKYKGKFPENPFSGGHYGKHDYPRATYAAMISHLDSDVGKLNSLLKEYGLDENTIVMFASDNGPHVEGGNDPLFFESSGGLRGEKRSLYEGGIRTPFIVKWPGKIKSGEVSQHVSAFWDVLPTLCDMAGVKAPEDLDGISFYPELIGEKQKNHELLYWEFHGYTGDKQAIRKGKWKAVRNKIIKANMPIELYNLELDPFEQNDVSEQFPDMITEMKSLLDKTHVQSEDFPFEYEL